MNPFIGHSVVELLIWTVEFRYCSLVSKTVRVDLLLLVQRVCHIIG